MCNRPTGRGQTVSEVEVDRSGETGAETRTESREQENKYSEQSDRVVTSHSAGARNSQDGRREGGASARSPTSRIENQLTGARTIGSGQSGRGKRRHLVGSRQTRDCSTRGGRKRVTRNLVDVDVGAVGVGLQAPTRRGGGSRYRNSPFAARTRILHQFDTNGGSIKTGRGDGSGAIREREWGNR